MYIYTINNHTHLICQDNRRLTESLEVLKKSGISSDFTLFVIQNIQLLGAV